MASCTQIDKLLQTYVDGAVGHSERLIVEHHVEECSRCKALLRKHQRTSAVLFETLGEHRLNRDLASSVLESLPEMDLGLFDMAGLNKRAKHQRTFADRLRRLVPVAAAVLLVIMAGVIHENWPSPAVAQYVLGVVTSSEGLALRTLDSGADEKRAKVKSLVNPGDVFETSDGAMMMLSILGPTQVKLNESTKIQVHDDRRISVLKGQVLLDVGKDERQFHVTTRFGDITVFGTTFDVLVDANSTRVVVKEGAVRVKYGAENSEKRSSLLRPNEQVLVTRGHGASLKYVDAGHETRWAKQIVPDEEASAFFLAEIQPNHEAVEVPGSQFWRWHFSDQPVKGVRIEWEPDNLTSGHCGYEFYVYSDIDHQNLVFKGSIEGSVFADEKRNSFFLKNTSDPATPYRYLFMKDVPLFSEGSVETEFRNAKLLLDKSTSN